MQKDMEEINPDYVIYMFTRNDIENSRTIKKAHRKYSKPAFADIDGDDDFDVFIGIDYGKIKYYENQGTSSSAAFAEITGSGNPLDVVGVGYQGSG